MVIIDAGHGGVEPGGGSNKYFKEKDLTLAISLYQYYRLKELSIPVELTRSTDTTLPPTNRIQKVNSIPPDGKNDILISNHINVDFGNYDGAEVVYSINNSSDFAKLIANNLKAAGQELSSNGIYTRKNKSGDDYYFIIRQTRPYQSVIVEYGFADSKKDDVNQLRFDFLNLAESVVKSICEYLGYKYTPPKGFYTVKKGDSLFSIAKKYNTNVDLIKRINNLSSNNLSVGQELFIPTKTS